MNKIDIILTELENRLNKGQIPRLEDFSNVEDKEAIQYLKEIFNFDFIKEILNRNDENNSKKEQIREIQLYQFDRIKLIANKDSTFKSPFMNHRQFMLAIKLLTIKMGENWNVKNPFVSFKWFICDYQLRVSIIHPNCTSDKQAKMFIRVQSKAIFTLNSFEINNEEIQLVKNLIRNKKNILISGATGSGKTSFLNTLIKEIDANEHVLILEDTDEIITSSHFQTKLITTNNEKSKLVDYCRYSMRMSPDRIIVGELRSDEVAPFLMALNTGHSGCLSTLHANNALDAIDRLCLLFKIYCSQSDLKFETIQKLLCNSIDYIIHLEYRQLMEVIEIKKAHNGVISFNQKIKKRPESNSGPFL